MSVASPSGIKKVAASYECRITLGDQEGCRTKTTSTTTASSIKQQTRPDILIPEAEAT